MQTKFFTVSFGGATESLPYYVFEGSQKGIDLVVTAGMHGNEVNGMVLAREFVRWMTENDIESKMKGRVTVFPVLNTSGFGDFSRYVTHDNMDLNRQFGKTESDSFSTNLANQLSLNFFAKADALIDLHDAGNGAMLVPHCRIHKDDEINCISCSREMSKVFGTEVVYEREGHRNMMAVALRNLYNTPVVTVEIGGDQDVFKDLFEVGMRGLKNYLKYANIIEGDVELPKTQYYCEDRYSRKADAGIIVKWHKKLGDFVQAGESLGKFYYPLTQDI